MSFKFVPDTDTSLTALDASTVDRLSISGMFVGDEKRVQFRIGNLNASDTDFKTSATGNNSSIIDDVDFSVDQGATFTTTATASGIRPNQVSDPIIARYRSQPGDVVGIGSYLITIDEE